MRLRPFVKRLPILRTYLCPWTLSARAILEWWNKNFEKIKSVSFFMQSNFLPLPLTSSPQNAMATFSNYVNEKYMLELKNGE